MAMPEIPVASVERLTFAQMMETSEHTAAMARLFAQQQRLQHELAGFRAEAATEFGALRSDLEAVKAEQARQGAVLAEILRRLPEPGTS